jgi:hypothetical protein
VGRYILGSFLRRHYFIEIVGFVSLTSEENNLNPMARLPLDQGNGATKFSIDGHLCLNSL